MGISIDEKTKNLKIKMSSAFFSMFSSYDSLDVENALEFLSKKEKDMISLLYGLDGEHCLDYDEIADKYNLDIDEVDEIIDTGINKIKEILKTSKVSNETNKSLKEKIDNGSLSKPIKKLKERPIKRNREDFYSNFENFSEEKINEALLLLEDKSREIIELYYGLKGEVLSQKDIAYK